LLPLLRGLEAAFANQHSTGKLLRGTWTRTKNPLGSTARRHSPNYSNHYLAENWLPAWLYVVDINNNDLESSGAITVQAAESDALVVAKTPYWPVVSGFPITRAPPVHLENLKIQR
jgi:hypothetical protein